VNGLKKHPQTRDPAAPGNRAAGEDRSGQAPGSPERPGGEESVTFLQVEPTTRCNYTCGFCCGRHMDQSDMSLETFARVLEQFPRVRHLELQGEGEPLLHPDFFEMLGLARARGIRVSTITNGSLFTAGNIDKLLDSGLTSILISIESPDPGEFRSIRGGKLEKVLRGIQALIEARKRRDLTGPVVGFAVTVLKETRDRLPEIAALYKRLQMDGGVLLHILSAMDVHTQHYDASLSARLISKIEQALVWSQYSKIRKSSDYRESGVRHFWDELLSLQKGERSETTRVSTFRSCPWLDHALFVDRHGAALPCPNIKDTAKHALGTIDVDAPERILAARRVLGNAIRAGVVSEGCCGCFIAESISCRTTNLLGKYPRRASSPDMVHPPAEPVDCDPEVRSLIQELSDGARSCSDIILAIADHKQLTPEAGRVTALPVIEELIRTRRLIV
jgi:MoaA/NifB/PqqE/SkfB family radical SAM enzyme